MAAERAVACAVDGELVPASGAGAEKGDVILGVDGRVEIKRTFASGVWTIPRHQLAQVLTAYRLEGRAGVILCIEERPVLELVPIPDGEAVSPSWFSPRIPQSTGSLSFSAPKHMAFVRQDPEGFGVVHVLKHKWVLRRFRYDNWT